jgi:SPOR domain
VAAPPDSCPVCGATALTGQEYCLDCGSRLAAVRPVSSLGRACRRRFGRYPGDWLVASLLLLPVAAGSAAAGIAARRGAPARDTHTIIATSPVVSAPVAPPAAATAAPKRSSGKKAGPAAGPKAKQSATLGEWPARNGYTVVLASIPAHGSGLADARARARSALEAGAPTVGVLVSSRFASLHPGYYVVFSGVYDSLAEAQTAAARLKGRYPNAYARQIDR